MTATGHRGQRAIQRRAESVRLQPNVRTNADDPLPGRNVHAVDTVTGQRYSAVTGVTGGFSIKVPPGKYRLELELREQETVVQQPGIIDINKSDLDTDLNIVVR